jgi:uncharacterized protein YndB with AHSA1/START domain
MAQPRHVFETYVKASQDRIWQALIDPELTSRYFFDARVESTWDVGAPYRYEIDGRGAVIAGEVIEADPPKRLVLSFRALFDDDTAAEPPSRVTWEITPVGSVCRLTCVHTDLFGAPRTWAATADGWNVVLSSLKTLLETGDALGEISDDGGSPFTSTTPPDEQWHRSLGIECNNGVYDLLDKQDRTDAETQMMVDTAHAAKYHWGKVGTPVNQVRGDYLCSRVYACVGRAEPALHHARRAVADADSLGLADFDLAFVHEALARALACAGDAEAARRELDLVRAVVIADAEDREIFEADLAKEPWYGITV